MDYTFQQSDSPLTVSQFLTFGNNGMLEASERVIHLIHVFLVGVGILKVFHSGLFIEILTCWKHNFRVYFPSSCSFNLRGPFHSIFSILYKHSNIALNIKELLISERQKDQHIKYEYVPQVKFLTKKDFLKVVL